MVTKEYRGGDTGMTRGEKVGRQRKGGETSPAMALGLKATESYSGLRKNKDVHRENANEGHRI